MSNGIDMNERNHSHDESPELTAPADTPVDAGSQALSEALRSSFAIVRFVMIVLVLVFFASGFFTVGPAQRAIILRFGKPLHGESEQALLGPGKLHWSMPYPIDEVVKVNISGIQTVESTTGWYAETPEQRLANIEPPAPAGTPLNPLVDGYVLTGDDNIIHSRATLTYRISAPLRYVFSFVNASNAVQDALDNALLWAASQFRVDDVLRHDVAGFQEAVRRRALQLIQQQDLGITVEQCVVQSVRPRQLKDAFDQVNSADEARGKAVIAAHAAENQITNQASADARSIVALAQVESDQLVKDLAAQAERFKDILPQYQRAPGLFTQQQLSETLGRVLTNVEDKILVAEGADGKPRELRLLFNREFTKRAP